MILVNLVDLVNLVSVFNTYYGHLALGALVQDT